MEEVAPGVRIVACLLERAADRRPLARREVETVAIGRDGTLLGFEGVAGGASLFEPSLRARGGVVRLEVETPTLHALIVSPGAAPLEWARGQVGASVRLVDGRATRIELMGGAVPPLVHDGAGWREERTRGAGLLPTTWAGHLLLGASADAASRALGAAHDERLTRAPRPSGEARTRPRPQPRPRRASRHRPPS